MTVTQLRTTDSATPTVHSDDPSRRLGWERVRGWATSWALAAAAVAALGETAGTVVAGHLAERPTSALVELLAINGLEAPASTDGAAARAPIHVQLTTGDVGAFRAVAERIFGETFPDVASVDVAAVAS